MKRTTISLDEDTRRYLKLKGAHVDKSISQLIREAVAKQRAEEEEEAELEYIDAMLEERKNDPVYSWKETRKKLKKQGIL